jgi:hypothetical protein
MPKVPKVEESAFSANQFLFKLIVPTAHTLTLAHFSSLQTLGTSRLLVRHNQIISDLAQKSRFFMTKQITICWKINNVWLLRQIFKSRSNR